MAEKYKTCQHSTGNVGELIVYVRPGCPRLSMIWRKQMSFRDFPEILLEQQKGEQSV